jgi:hypothetical protein
MYEIQVDQGIVGAIAGFFDNSEQNEINFALEGLDLTPQKNSASLKQVIHYSQLIFSNKFALFDHGCPQLNEAYYDGQAYAPTIPLQDISYVPIGLFVGKKDTLAKVYNIYNC